MSSISMNETVTIKGVERDAQSIQTNRPKKKSYPPGSSISSWERYGSKQTESNESDLYYQKLLLT
jgi:hypothetical protein